MSTEKYAPPPPAAPVEVHPQIPPLDTRVSVPCWNDSRLCTLDELDRIAKKFGDTAEKTRGVLTEQQDIADGVVEGSDAHPHDSLSQVVHTIEHAGGPYALPVAGVVGGLALLALGLSARRPRYSMGRAHSGPRLLPQLWQH